MDIKAALLEEHSKAQALKIADYVGQHPEYFETLLSLFLHENYRITQRAAWPLVFVVEAQPQLIKPHLRKVVENLQGAVNVAVKRNTLRFLQLMDLPEDLLGLAAEICFAFLDDPQEAIAVRVFSMTVLYNICVKEPELGNELRMVIEDHLPHGSAGFKSRGKKILKALSKLS
ncbi:MAG: hypothetical protein AAGD05_03475 [Bacteroidota bacterium]